MKTNVTHLKINTPLHRFMVVLVVWLLVIVGIWVAVAEAAPLTISGSLYEYDRATLITTSKTIKVAVATTTVSVHSTSTDSGAGTWSVTIPDGHSIAASTPISVFVDGDATKAVTVTKASSTANITSLDLYQDHVTLKSEGTGTTTKATDLYHYDSSNDSDIQFTASSSLGRLTIASGQTLYIASSTTFHMDLPTVAHSFETATTATTLASSTLELTGNFTQNGAFKTAASDATVWTSRVSAADNSWQSVTYGNGLFVAVSITGTNNRVMTSPDGITWTSRTSAADNLWSSVVYGNGLFVAVCDDNRGTACSSIMTSPDGITWTSRTHGVASGWTGVTFSENLFVAVADFGTNRVMTSPDGITWTARTAAADNSWQSVTYGNGFFVAVSKSGTNNRVMTSPDGITWTSRTSAADNSWQSVTYGNGLFVAVSFTGTNNRVMTSPDGITWTIRTSAANNSWYSVTYGNGLFVAVSSDGTNRVMTSPDGITWTSRTSAANNTWYSVTYGNGLFVAVACGVNSTSCDTTAGNRVMTSAESHPVSLTGTTAQVAAGDMTGANALPHVVTANAGTKTFTDHASTSDFVIESTSGTVTAPVTLTVAGNYSNSSTFVAPTSLYFTKTGNQTATGTWSGSPNLTLGGSGQKIFTTTVTTTNLTIVSGIEFIAPPNLTVLGNYNNTGTSTYTAAHWTSRTSAVDNNWSSVTYGNGLFVAVSNSGTGNRVMTSPDGITWTSRTSAADNLWNSVTYGNGLFVAVSHSGTNNRVMTSPDGITWTSRTSAANNTWYSVTYGNSLFVAVAGSGTNNRVMTSPDGITWTSRTSAADNEWRSVTYGNGLFVAVSVTGTNNRVMTSPDGITWTIRTSAADNGWYSVTYGNGFFVAVSNSGTNNRVMTSPDGITWTSRTSAANNAWNSVTYGNGLFVAVACGVNATSCNITAGNRVMTSPDGITWTSRTSVEDNYWYSVTYGNSLFVAVSDANAGTISNRVMTSPVGTVNFASASAQIIEGSLTGASAFSPVTFSGAGAKTFADNASTSDFTVQSGSGEVITPAQLTVAGDYVNNGTTTQAGANWEAYTAIESNYWNSITYGNGLFVAVGELNSGTHSVMTSPDGITWTARSAVGNNDGWYSVTYGNGLFVAVGYYNDRVMTSPDGITWTARSAVGNNDSWISVTYGNGLFVAVSIGWDGEDRVMTSPDGITWTARSAAGNDDSWQSITYGNGLFVVVGDGDGVGGGDRVMTSPDGITWTARTSAEDNYWYSVTYGNGIFVAVSSDGTNRVMTSPDGTTWTARSAVGNDDSWYSVTYGSNLFVAVGDLNSGTDSIMTSPDGITWTGRIAAENDWWFSVTYGNGLFVVVATSNHVMTSGTTLTFAGASDQTVGGSLTGASTLNKVVVANTGTTTFTASASTAVLTINTGVTVVAPTTLSIYGDYTNSGTFTASTSEVILNGRQIQTATGTMTGTSAFDDLTLTNISGSTSSPAIIFGAPLTTTGTFTMIANTSAAFLAGATSTFENVDWQGSADNEVVLRSTSDGDQWYLDIPGTQLNVEYVDVQDSNASSSAGGAVAAYGSTDAGNNSNWTFGDIPETPTGSSTLQNHDDTQVNNAFTFQNVTNGALFAFNLTPNSGTTTITDLTISIIGTHHIDSTDFSNLRLFRDLDSDAAYDATDTQVGGAGAMTITNQTGTITFTGDFLATTTQNYLIIADWNAPQNGSYLRLALPTSGITATDDSGTEDIYGSVSSIQHNRNNKGGGGGAAAIGGEAPEGDGDVSGGTDDGGDSVGNEEIPGEQIGDPANYKWPTSHSGTWNDGAYAYDRTNNTHATTSTEGALASFLNHSFSVPGANVITGIEVKLEVSASTGAGDIGVQLSYDGGNSWTTAKTTDTLTTSDVIVTLGGPADTWGRAWTPANFSNANFAVRLTGNPDANMVRVDGIVVRVYHQAGGGGAGGGGGI